MSAYYKPAEIADILGVNPTTARSIIRANIPYMRLGKGRMLVRKVDFDAWQTNVTVVPQGTAPRVRPYNTDEDDRREFHRRRRA